MFHIIWNTPQQKAAALFGGAFLLICATWSWSSHEKLSHAPNLIFLGDTEPHTSYFVGLEDVFDVQTLIDPVRTAIGRAAENDGHVMFTFVDDDYVDVARNWLEIAPEETKKSVTIFTTSNIAHESLQPFAVIVKLSIEETIGCVKEWPRPWVAKHGIYLALLRAASERNSGVDFVTWFDADCIVLETYNDWLLAALEGIKDADTVNLIAQMGLSPYEIKNTIGAGICVGLYTMRPSTSDFYESFFSQFKAQNLIGNMNGPPFLQCAQSDEQADFTFRVRSAGGLQLDEKLIWGTNNSELKLSAPNHGSIRTAFLPFKIFPREFPSQTVNKMTFNRLRANGARVWHLPANKNGRSKEKAMQRDGVWCLDEDDSEIIRYDAVLEQNIVSVIFVHSGEDYKKHSQHAIKQISYPGGNNTGSIGGWIEQADAARLSEGREANLTGVGTVICRKFELDTEGNVAVLYAEHLSSDSSSTTIPVKYVSNAAGLTRLRFRVRWAHNQTTGALYEIDEETTAIADDPSLKTLRVATNIHIMGKGNFIVTNSDSTGPDIELEFLSDRKQRAWCWNSRKHVLMGT